MAIAIARLVAANAVTGRHCGGLVLIMVIADETDAAAMVRWRHYKACADLEELAYRAAQAEDDPSTDVNTMGNRKKLGIGTARSPIDQGVLVGSFAFASVARMLDELVAGMESFGTRIQPLMRCRAGVERTGVEAVGQG